MILVVLAISTRLASSWPQRTSPVRPSATAQRAGCYKRRTVERIRRVLFWYFRIDHFRRRTAGSGSLSLRTAFLAECRLAVPRPHRR